jgi:hypothetical protein
MKNRNLLKAFSLAALLIGLTGCDKSPETTPAQRPASAPIQKDPQKRPAASPDAPTTKELLDYYSAHLEEAKTKWHECQAKGLQNVNDDEKPRCVAAGNAWHNQPYKPKR